MPPTLACTIPIQCRALQVQVAAVLSVLALVLGCAVALTLACMTHHKFLSNLFFKSWLAGTVAAFAVCFAYGSSICCKPPSFTYSRKLVRKALSSKALITLLLAFLDA